MRLLVIAVLLVTAGRAHAEPWWQQFYARAGMRTALGLDRMTKPSLAIGYRHELGTWAVDHAAADVQRGLDEGVHELAHLSIVRKYPAGPWISVGAGYSIARGWTETDLPLRRGHGLQVGASLGYDRRVSSSVRIFAQVAVGLPLYDLRDTYRSTDSSTHVVTFDAAIGGRF